jgi:hypothetical protein
LLHSLELDACGHSVLNASPSPVNTALTLLRQLPILADVPEPDLETLARQVVFRNYAREEETFTRAIPQTGSGGFTPGR